jgi:hypothetical protein
LVHGNKGVHIASWSECLQISFYKSKPTKTHMAMDVVAAIALMGRLVWVDAALSCKKCIRFIAFC